MPRPPGGLRRLQIQTYPAYTLSASGLSSNHQEVVLAKQLSLIRSSDALKLCEIFGLAPQQRRPERPPPDGEETRKPGVRDGALIGPGTIFEAFFGYQFLISAVGFGHGTDVAQYIARMGPIGRRAGTFIVVQHAIGEFDVEGRPGRTALVG